jgi:alpha-N-acetylglucosamine transferase
MNLPASTAKELKVIQKIIHDCLSRHHQKIERHSHRFILLTIPPMQMPSCIQDSFIKVAMLNRQLFHWCCCLLSMDLVVSRKLDDAYLWPPQAEVEAIRVLKRKVLL